MLRTLRLDWQTSEPNLTLEVNDLPTGMRLNLASSLTLNTRYSLSRDLMLTHDFLPNLFPVVRRKKVSLFRPINLRTKNHFLSAGKGCGDIASYKSGKRCRHAHHSRNLGAGRWLDSIHAAEKRIECSLSNPMRSDLIGFHLGGIVIASISKHN